MGVNKQITKAVILSAGKGSRLLSITNEYPKTMINIRGKPVLEHNIILCKNYGINEIYINTHHAPEIIENYFLDGKKYGVKILYSREKKIMGTAGSLLGFKDYIKDEEFLLIYGDNLFMINLSSFFKFHYSKKSRFSILAHWRDDCSSSGKLNFNDQKLLNNIYEKEPSNKTKGYVNAGMYIIKNMQDFNSLIYEGSDFSYNVIPRLIDRKLIYVYETKEMVYPIDNQYLLNDTITKLESQK